MTVLEARRRAAAALKGGSGSTPIYEDGPEAAAVWAVAEQMEDGHTTSRYYYALTNHNVVIGIHISSGPNSGKAIYTRYYSTQKTWTGIGLH